ncbi:MAG: hypothetical protein IPK28_06825 [Devosia sp.]|nr:hypothetical protein [Devosia sp.]
MGDVEEASDDPVHAYKAILRRVLDTRPSGARQRLADALGKHRSFITQICSPAYSTPVPPRHLETMFSVCHFAPAEREAFLAAYLRAHPRKLEAVEMPARRQLVLDVPNLGKAERNTAFDKALAEFVGRLGTLMQHPGGDE